MTGAAYINGYYSVLVHEFFHRDVDIYNYMVYGHGGRNFEGKSLISPEFDPDRDGMDTFYETMIADLGANPFWPDDPEELARTAQRRAQANGEFKWRPYDWSNPGSNFAEGF